MDGMGPSEVSAGITALIVLGGLVLVMRWVFAPPRRGHTVRPPVDASDSRELGLLMVIATAVPYAQAQQLRTRLHEAGIRSSVSRRADGTRDLLVFAPDVERARATLAG